MRALIQRVTQAQVVVENEIVGAIAKGLVILLGVGEDDGEAEARQLADKIANLRIFSDDAGKFNRSLVDIGGEALVVSQFTLYADTRKGRRPSFVHAAHPDIAAPLVDRFCAMLRDLNIVVATGVFGAHMQVQLTNNGPVTIWLDTDDGQRSRQGTKG
jgi:D-tyrosyl-tRNA(Tyr) deacylase